MLFIHIFCLFMRPTYVLMSILENTPLHNVSCLAYCILHICILVHTYILYQLDFLELLGLSPSGCCRFHVLSLMLTQYGNIYLICYTPMLHYSKISYTLAINPWVVLNYRTTGSHPAAIQITIHGSQEIIIQSTEYSIGWCHSKQ